MKPRTIRKFIYDFTCLCLLINFLVKIGIIYGFKIKEILAIGCIIDLLGVWLIAKMGRQI